MVLTDEDAVDVEAASAGRWGPAPISPYEDWAGFAAWAADPGEGNACDERLLRASAANESR